MAFLTASRPSASPRTPSGRQQLYERYYSGDPVRLAGTLYGLYDKDTHIDRIIGMLDDLEAGPLADLVIANLPVAVAEKARYAAETKLAERLRIARALTQAVAASGGAPAR